MKRSLTLAPVLILLVASHAGAQEVTPNPTPAVLKVLDTSAPEYTWVPQDSAVLGLNQYQAAVCNESGALLKVTEKRWR